MPRGKIRSVKQREAHSLHQHVWRHNSFMGMAKMMERQADNIADAPSTTESTKSICREISRLAKQLDKALRAERIDP